MHRFVKNDVDRLILECLVSRAAARLDLVTALYAQIGDDDRVWRAAKANRCASIVARRLLDAEISDLPGHWLEAWDGTERRIQAYLKTLDEVAEALAAAGIPLVALKNGGIARGLYQFPGECPMGDLDVLVERGRFAEAHQVLEGLGFELEFRVAESIEEKGLEAGLKSGGTEYRRLLPGGEELWFELQWRPVAGRWIRPDAEPSGDDLVARSVPIEGTRVRLLAPLDNLMQVCLHTAKHTYLRAPGVRLHTDVDRIVRSQDIDWDAFVAWTRDLEVCTAVYFSLAIPQALLGTPIPQDVLRRLAPSRGKRELMLRWLRQAGLFDADAHKFGKARFIAFAMLLYDDTSALRRGIFPEWSHMAEQYDLRHRWQLPLAHGRRILDLAFRRAKRV